MAIERSDQMPIVVLNDVLVTVLSGGQRIVVRVTQKAVDDSGGRDANRVRLVETLWPRIEPIVQKKIDAGTFDPYGCIATDSADLTSCHEGPDVANHAGPPAPEEPVASSGQAAQPPVSTAR